MMFAKVCALYVLLLGIALAHSDHILPNWDIAVAVDEQIELLLSNGSVLPVTLDMFNEIKALTYHFNRGEFIVADRDRNNDTIYLFDPSTKKRRAIVEDLPDDIQGISVDMQTETVFWADATNQSINTQSLRETNTDSFDTLIDLPEEYQDIAVDSCKATIYWTHSNLQLGAPAIEKSSTTGTDHKVLVASDLYMPSGIAIDQLEQRIYWADKRLGIYFRIESVDFDGTDRRVFFQGTHQKPHRLAVDASYVYWTDTSNNALWRKSKRNASEPEMLRSFHGTPTGIVARFVGFPEPPNCDKLAVLISEQRQMSALHEIAIDTDNKSCAVCINGHLNATDCTCLCNRGFTGAQCNIELCHNYCHNGKCEISSDAKPQCVCEKGYNDTRCEKHVCDNYCLNGGACSLQSDTSLPQCSCRRGFDGHRCDIVLPVTNFEICQSVCANTSANIIIYNQNSFPCRCSELAIQSLDVRNCTQSSSAVASISADMKEIIRHPVFVGMMAGNLITLLLVITLIGYICKQKRMRPRIKKRVVVNKNITPLTYRPQNSEVCEITIEDCCNMNICETPCFEPRNFQTKKEDKKALLSGMENNEEFY